MLGVRLIVTEQCTWSLVGVRNHFDIAALGDQAERALMPVARPSGGGVAAAIRTEGQSEASRGEGRRRSR